MRNHKALFIFHGVLKKNMNYVCHISTWTAVMNGHGLDCLPLIQLSEMILNQITQCVNERVLKQFFPGLKAIQYIK